MNLIFQAEIVYALAFAVLSILLLQAFALTYKTLQRAALDRREHEYAQALWRTKLDNALIRRRAYENTEQSWNGFRKFEIEKRVEEAENIASFYLRPHDKKPVASFLPGQYLTFLLDIPDRPKSIRRCYSLSDFTADEGYYRVTIKRIEANQALGMTAGIASTWFYEQVKEGDILDIMAPGGNFTLDPDRNSPVVLLCGGIGITPCLCMLNAILKSPAGASREIWFFYGVDHGGQHAMKEHLASLDKKFPNLNLHVCYAKPRPQDQEGDDYQHKGWVSVDLLKEHLPSNNYDYYICGPSAMLESLTRDLRAWNVPEKHVYYETFGPASVKKGPIAAKAVEERDPATPPYQVTFSKSGKTLPWEPNAGTLLELAEAADIGVDFGCRAGNCGACLLAIREGEVDVLDDAGAVTEDGSCLACISVPKSDLVLDI